jgi:predicted transcriptional regulator
MKSYLTLRLPATLARSLARLARARGVPKSQVVREAVSQYLLGNDQSPTRIVTGGELAKSWATVPTLTPEEYDDFAKDISDSRSKLRPLKSAWK